MSCTNCGNPRCSGCNSCIPGTPLPFFAESPSCQESHCQVVISQELFATVCIGSFWNVPSCGGSAQIIIPNLKALIPGSYLWNETYGFFKVVSFDSDTGQTSLQNTCQDANAPAGTEVPACTCFVVTVPPGDTGNDNNPFPYVAIDFTAPAVSNCIDITVTSVAGLSVGQVIQIGSGQYSISGILSGTIINICNDGEGIVPGTPVIAKDAGGNYQYPIVIINDSPCSLAPITEGTLLICNNLTQKPLKGTSVGQVPVLQDVTDYKVEFEYLDVGTRLCTTLVNALNLVSGTAGYSITVASTAGFTNGDRVQLGLRTDRFIVTIVDGTHFTVVADPTPSVTETVPAGVSVCLIGCCESLQDQIDNISPIISAQCVPQMIIGDIPLQIFPTNIILTSGFFDVEISSNIREYIPPGICNYLIKAVASVAVVLDYDSGGTDPTPIYQEIELVWDTAAPPHQNGKSVWMEYFNDNRPSFPAGDTTFNAITLLPRRPINYHQADISAYTQSAGGVSNKLRLLYRVLQGTGSPPATIHPISLIMVSGLIEIYRI